MSIVAEHIPDRVKTTKAVAQKLNFRQTLYRHIALTTLVSPQASVQEKQIYRLRIRLLSGKRLNTTGSKRIRSLSGANVPQRAQYENLKRKKKQRFILNLRKL